MYFFPSMSWAYGSDTATCRLDAVGATGAVVAGSPRIVTRAIGWVPQIPLASMVKGVLTSLYTVLSEGGPRSGSSGAGFASKARSTGVFMRSPLVMPLRKSLSNEPAF